MNIASSVANRVAVWFARVFATVVAIRGAIGFATVFATGFARGFAPPRPGAPFADTSNPFPIKRRQPQLSTGVQPEPQTRLRAVARGS